MTKSRGAAVITLAALLTPTLAACGSNDEFTANGTVVHGSYYYSYDGKCARAKGVSQGDQVVIMDGSGTEVALGNLVLGENNSDGKPCQWDFTIDGIPAGEAVYKLKIGSREAPSYTQDELESGVMLSFG